MRRRVDDLLLEREVAFIEEREHRFVLLREERDEVHPAVMIQIDGDDLDAAWPRIDHVRDERRLRGIGGLVLQDRDLARLAPPEGSDREIRLAVAIEIG